MGVTAGVPPRVEAGTKAALLDLVDGAVGEGWSTARACSVLELDGRRCRRWQHRRGAGRLEDSTAGGTASHAITPTERRAILELFERWGDIDGGYRKLAHRGSYENLVWVSPSTLYRVLAAQGLVLPARAQRAPAPARPLPDWIEWRRHQIWIYDITHFPRAARVAYAILDVVTRKWLATLVTAEETATQVEVVFTEALDTEGLWPAVEARQADRARRGDDSDEEPILLAMSDNGPQMRAGTTREFLAMCSIASRFGRPGTPTDQAWIETLFGHVKTEWPHLEKITDPNTLRAELDIARHDYNTRRLHASLGYVTPDDEHQGRGQRIRQARQDGLKQARLTRIAYHRNNKPNQPCIYDIPDADLGAATVNQLAQDLQDPAMPPEINRLGRTIWNWRHQIANWHAARVTNAATETANNLIKRVKRVAFGFTNFANYRIRALLYAGKPNWALLDTLTPP